MTNIQVKQLKPTVIVSKRSRGIRMKLDRRGLVITTPRPLSQSYVQKILTKHSNWLSKHADKLEPQGIEQKLFYGATLEFCGLRYLLREKSMSDRRKGIIFEATEILVDREAFPDLLLQALRKRGGDYLRERTRQLADLHSLKYNRVFIKDNLSNWGSCSSKRNINLNWRLCFAPLYVSDYVIAHELAHTVELNHSASFWSLVAKICPGYTAAKKWLQEHGNSI